MLRRIFGYLVLLLPVALHAQVTLNKPRLDSLFDSLDKYHKSMCAVAVSQNGKLLYSRRIGFRDSTKSGPVRYPDADTRYRIGSISKVFTAVIVHQLVAEGKLHYDTKLSQFYPQFPYVDSVTIGQMLSHHSGLPHYQSGGELDKLQRKSKTPEAMIAIVSKQPRIQKDVTNGHYSNLNYMLLGLIIERVTGSSFDEQLKSRITGPLGLKNTYNLQNYIDASKNEAHSFNYRSGKWVEDWETKWNFTDASGWMVSTPEDLNTFMAALFNGKLVSDSALQKMTTIKDHYGMGLMEAPFNEHKGFGHTGRIQGFTAATGYMPQDSLAFSLVVNGNIYPMNDIAIGVMSCLYNAPYTVPDFKPVTLTEQQKQPLLGTYQGEEIKMWVNVRENKKTKDLEAKMKLRTPLALTALSPTRLMSDAQGIIFDFTQDSDGKVQKMVMRTQGARIHCNKQP